MIIARATCFRDPRRVGDAYVIFAVTPNNEEVQFESAKVTPISELDLTQESSGLVMNRETATALMESLWAAGIRPTQVVGTEAVDKAKDKHLEDMRKIAFTQLKMQDRL